MSPLVALFRETDDETLEHDNGGYRTRVRGSEHSDCRRQAGSCHRQELGCDLRKFGFVIDEKNAYPPPNSSHQILIASPDAVSAELMPPAKGYFVVKTATGWRRVAMAE